MAVRELALSSDLKSHIDYHKGHRSDQLYVADGTKEIFEMVLQEVLNIMQPFYEEKIDYTMR